MAKKEAKQTAKLVFTTGVNLADERRFEKGDIVPVDVSEKELETLREMNAVAEAE